MRQPQDQDTPAAQLSENSPGDLPCSDAEYKIGMQLLKNNFPAFQRYQRELIQFIGDNLASANLLIGASIKDKSIAFHDVPTERLILLRSINKSIFAKLRGEKQ